MSIFNFNSMQNRRRSKLPGTPLDRRDQHKISAPAIEPLEERKFLSGITPVIVSSNVPSELIGGAKLHSNLKVALTDTLPTAESGFTLSVYAAPTQVLDLSVDRLVTSVVKSNTIKPLHTLNVSVPIKGLPADLPNGTYYLITQTTDAAGNTDSISTNSTVTVAAPFVNLLESVSTTFPPQLISGSNIKGAVNISLTNQGNIAAKGAASFNITAATTAGVIGTSITTTVKNINVPVGKTSKVSVKVKTLPVLADGTYFIVAQVTDPKGGISTGTSPALTISAPHVTLSATLSSIVNIKSGVNVLVTNTGNTADTTKLHGTFGFSTDAAGTVPAGGATTISSKQLTIKPGKTVSFHIKPSKATLASLQSGIPLYVTVAYSDDSGQIGNAVTPNTFTL